MERTSSMRQNSVGEPPGTSQMHSWCPASPIKWGQGRCVLSAQIMGPSYPADCQELKELFVFAKTGLVIDGYLVMGK